MTICVILFSHTSYPSLWSSHPPLPPLSQGVPLTSYMEQLMTTSIAGNASNGRLALENVILRVQSEAKDIKDTLNKLDSDLKTSLDDIIKEAPRQTKL